jgi:glucose/arabinose dehydrogenase
MRTFAPRLAVCLFSNALLLLAAGCSGGGGGSTPLPAPSAPPAGDATPPTVPSNVTAVAQSATSILVSWTASTDAGAGLAGYRVFRDGGATPVATVNAPTTTFTDNGLTAATQYSYTVAAFDLATPTANVSAASAAATATTNPNPSVDTTPPTVPQNVTATAQSANSIVVSWNASTDAGTGLAGYRVFRDGGATPIATVNAPATTYTDTGLTAATAYSYTVSAFDAASPANVSAASVAASATTSAVPLALTVQRVFPNLTFNQPIAALQAPNDDTRWYVVEKTGIVRSFANTANAATTSVFIDISARLNSNPNSRDDERGLLGMAFHPNYPTDPRVYLFYTGTSGGNLVDRVSQFRLNTAGTALDAATELELLNVADPETNHNGGNIAFGPDGFLYIGIGDGGGANDAHGSPGNGQRLTTLLGKMLRIDVANASAGTPYAIPMGASGNPFAANARCTGGTGAASCPEIYAYGFRNPWRWSFDRGGTNELWLADVGQMTLEEVDIVVRGGNYGWRCFEGTEPFNADCGSNPDPIAPVAQYGRSLGFSTTGGFVYRGAAIPGLVGRYVFGDFGGRLWHIARDTPPTLTLAAGSGQATGLAISSFGQDTAGELYVVHIGGSNPNTGTLHKIVP